MRAVALAVFFLSFISLLVYDALFPPAMLSPEQVTEELKGSNVIVRGAVTQIRSGNTTFMKLNRLPVVFFRNVSARKGDVVAVYGTVSEYHGRLELIGKRIYRWGGK